VDGVWGLLFFQKSPKESAMPAKLKNGVMGAPGGKRKNAGRTTDWLKEKCQAVIEKHDLIGFLSDVASGMFTEVVIVDGQKSIVKKSANPETRLKAAAMLLDRGFGKAHESIQLSGSVESRIILVHPK
jgi:hypothetical protein